ncbi:MAG: carbamoyltransferase [Pseudomonadota bacterium]
MSSVLGISAFYHDSAAALLIDGKLVAAAQEERFTRKKHDAGFPRQAINYVLDAGKLSLDDVSHIVFYDKPFLKFERLLETYVGNAPRGFKSFSVAIPVWIKEKLFQKSLLVNELNQIKKASDYGSRLMFAEHHVSHAASAYYPSPFNEAVVLTLDGVGEWATTTVAIGCGNDLEMVKEIHFPHSLGLLYSAVTYYTGFKVNSGEYKVMGLAPYGEPRFKDLFLDNIVDLKPDGSFRLNQDYFNYMTGLTMTNQKFADLFGRDVRAPESDRLDQFHMDMAASVQAVTEDIVLTMTRHLSRQYQIPNLCMAGGVALNCVANGKILRDRAFQNLWVQPAAGDAGGALGAAAAAWHQELGNERVVDPNALDGMKGSYLGPEYDQADIEKRLTAVGAHFERLDEAEMIERTAQHLAKGDAVGWFNGRMEFGPRALGARSILGDPRSDIMQKTLNLKVKFRESFRPFAPSVLREYVQDWFDLEEDSPYMLLVDRVKEDRCRDMSDLEKKLFGIEKLNITRSEVPAITHVDYSARIQTVHADTNPLYHQLISSFQAKTGCPLLVNTSFNVRGEPIVCTPEDAFRCFMGTDLDFLVVGNAIMEKKNQNKELVQDYKNKYDLD